MTELVRHICLSVMLYYEQTLFTQESVIRPAEFVQHQVVVHRIWRIEEDDVPAGFRSSSGEGLSLEIDHLGLAFRYIQKIEIFFDQRTRTTRFVDEGSECCSA